MIALINNWIRAVQNVVKHIGCMHGSHAPFYWLHIEKSPWPTEAFEVIHRDTARVAEYIETTLRLPVRNAIERLQTTAKTWAQKREAFEKFARIKNRSGKLAAQKAEDLIRLSETGMPEQRRLNLDLKIAEGAVWLALFALSAGSTRERDCFFYRRMLIRWAVWVQDAFASVIRDWPVPNEADPDFWRKIDDEKFNGFYESSERWELANIVAPRYIPNTD